MSAIEGTACRIGAPAYPSVIRIAARTKTAQVAAALAARFGTAPPPCRSTSCDAGLRLLWRAPGAWLLIGDSAALAVADLPGATTDLSGALACWTLEGAAWRAVLNTACPLDLEGGDFEPGACAASRFGAFDVLIDVVEPYVARVFSPRSYADDLDAALRRAATLL